MRTEDEVRYKYKQLVLRNLTRLFQKKLSKRPWNCVHHQYQPEIVTQDNLVEICQAGFCMYNSDHPEVWEGRVCETAADAIGCPFFTARQTKQEVYEEFMSFLGNTEMIQHGFRDLYILQWILGPVNLSWWDKFRLWFIKKLSITEKEEVILPSNEDMSVSDLSEKLFSNQQ